MTCRLHTQRPQRPKKLTSTWKQTVVVFFSMSLPRYIMESKLCTKLSKHCKFLLQSVSSKLSIYSLVFPYSDHNIFQYRSDLNILSPRCTIRYHTMVIFTCTQCFILLRPTPYCASRLLKHTGYQIVIFSRKLNRWIKWIRWGSTLLAEGNWIFEAIFRSLHPESVGRACKDLGGLLS